ncbi:TlpA family protein disulfide reductase [Rhodococcus sp. NPDC059234]|uniref:TlpA family protein disulfide reductase n=1 Tax=Rhodococcus sp. NPDC059234 TaxID=3346781 RepID=UPI003671621C
MRRLAAAPRALAGVAAVLATAVLVTACGTGSDAVAQGGTFDFVSPGGKTEIYYDPPSERGTLGQMSGPDVTVDGKTTALSDFDGKVVVVNLWGQWCGPCRGEADDLETVYDNTKDLGVEFLGINVKDSKQAAQDFIVNHKVGYPSIYDPSMRTLTALGGSFPTSVIPSTLVLDREHRVAAVFLKALLAEDLQPVVERVAREQ